jgi:microcystin-dependent protein
MAFTINTWTDQGRALLTGIVSGVGTFNITKIQAGKGYPALADNPASFVGLKSYVMDGQLTSINVEQPYQVTARIRVQSQNAPVAFRWNEFGIFANNGSGTAVLVAYGSTGSDTGDTITPSSSAANVNRDCAVLLPFTANVTVTTTAVLNPAPELHATTHRSTGADPLALAQTATSGVAPATPNDATQVLLGGAIASWGRLPAHALTHIDSGADPIPLTTTAHDGLCPKLSGNQMTVLRGDGTWGNGFVPGLIMDYAGSIPPAGWLMCDGQLYSTSLYPDLFAAIGYGYGGSGGSFAVPDCRGRTTIGTGQGPGLTNRSLASTGGEENHVLSYNELPVHNHGVNDPGHAHSVYDPTHAHGVSQSAHAHGVADGGHSHGVSDPGHAHWIINCVGEGLNIPGGYGQSIYNPLGGTWTSTEATRIGVYGAATGIGIYGANANISINGAYTGIGIYGSGTGISTQNAGANWGHNNMQPFITFSKIIRAF